MALVRGRLISVSAPTETGAPGEPGATVPSPQGLVAAGMAEPDNVQLHGCADREDDDCSSAGSESCWGEREDIAEDDVVEWGAGALPLPTRRMESRIVPGSNRFAALTDAETVSAGTQELEEVGVIRDRSSHVGDRDRVPETTVDALEEDLERPSRRLVLVGGGHQTPLTAEDTQWESGARFSFPAVPSESCRVSLRVQKVSWWT